MLQVWPPKKGRKEERKEVKEEGRKNKDIWDRYASLYPPSSRCQDGIKCARGGVPAVTQRDWQHLGSSGTQVRSPAWHSGLRIQHCHSCDLGPDRGLDLIPGLGTPYAAGQLKKEKKKFTEGYAWDRQRRKSRRSFIFWCRRKIGWEEFQMAL